MGLTSGPQDRTPQELVTELRGLTDVDWPTVWAGPPYPGKGLDMWCAQFGWTPLSFERVLQVRTDTGGELDLNASGGSWAPVDNLSHWIWGAGAEAVEDNPAVLEAADQAWPVYLTAVCSVLGEPAWEGTWEADDFPESLGTHPLGSREFRLTRKNPYRLAYWMRREGGGPLAVMTITLASGTAQGRFPGAANMAVKFYPRPLETGEL
ncbi:hypothetical protein [Streptomyces sp. NPDC002328]|uniref:hypothetical protein n=1 Tax=Streptomyces sp. NPDC002328 TaxID=3364642 RepID=UPI00367854C7